MDTITHGVTGALAGKAFFAERHGRAATVALTLGAVFPDSDVFFQLFAPNELATLEWHRGVTHSFVALPAFAALLAGITRYVVARRPEACSRRQALGRASPGFLTLWGLYALGLASHILLDLITSFGTMVWSPLSSARPAWDLVFILDLVFTGIVLLPQAVAWIYHEPAAARRRGALAWLLLSLLAAAMGAAAPLVAAPFPAATVLTVSALVGLFFLLPLLNGGWGFRQPRRVFCRIGLAGLAGYLALCTASHALAVKRVEEFARGASLEVKTLAALPAPLSPFRWSGLVLTPAGVYQSQFSLLDAQPPAFEFIASAPPNRYIEAAEHLASVRTFRWFARFPVVAYRNSGPLHIVEYSDLRFRGGFRRRPAFTYQVVLNAGARVLSAGWLGS